MDNNEKIPAWGQALIDNQKALIELINSSFSNGKFTNREAILEKKLEGADEGYKKRTLRDFARMKFNNEDDFQSYLKEIDSEIGSSDSEGGEEVEANDKYTFDSVMEQLKM